MKSNGINIIKIVKQLHPDFNRDENSYHYNIKELRNLEEQEEVNEKHIYVKNRKVAYITEIIKNFG